MDFEKFAKDKLGTLVMMLWQLEFQVKEQSEELERLRGETPPKG